MFLYKTPNKHICICICICICTDVILERKQVIFQRSRLASASALPELP